MHMDTKIHPDFYVRMPTYVIYSLLNLFKMDNRVPVTNFNIKNAKMWKTIDQKAIGALHYSRPFPHSPRNIKIQRSNVDTIALSDKIEGMSHTKLYTRK